MQPLDFDFEIDDKIIQQINEASNFVEKEVRSEKSLIKNQTKKDEIKNDEQTIVSYSSQKTKDTVKGELYPLFKNYPNGTSDYYLKLKSLKIRKNLKVFFAGNLFSYKYFNFFNSINCINNKEYDVIITTNLEKALKIKSNKPIICINCKPQGFINKERVFYFYDNKKLFEEMEYFLHSNKIKHLYRENSSDILEAVAKVQLEKETGE